MTQSQVVVFTPDVVGERMAGPGIRAYHFARELARHFSTTLIAKLERFDSAAEQFEAIDSANREAFNRLRNSPVVIGQPSRQLLALERRRQFVIYDLFDPVVLELNELYGGRPTLRQRIHLRREWGRLHAALRSGATLISAAARQQDFYAGIYAMTDGIRSDWSERWINVPFGVEESDPDETVPRPSSLIPPEVVSDAGRVTPDASTAVVVWSGGLWEWLDPDTAIAAVDEVNRRGVTCRLLFMGGTRPNQELARVGSSDRLRELIAQSPDHVIVNHGWVPYRDRARWLRSAKVAIMLHRRTLEAQFSIRTRLFDAIWCSLPVVATAGGFAADLIQCEGLGVVVEPSDVQSVADGIEKLLRDDAFYGRSVSNLRKIRERYTWTEVIRPLVQVVQQHLSR